MLRHIHLCLLAFLLAPLPLTAQVSQDILVLSSHTPSSEWVRNMLSPVLELDNERADIAVSLHHFQLLSHTSVPELEQSVEAVLDSLERRPSLVIMLGGSIFNFTERVHCLWESKITFATRNIPSLGQAIRQPAGIP